MRFRRKGFNLALFHCQRELNGLQLQRLTRGRHRRWRNNNRRSSRWGDDGLRRDGGGAASATRSHTQSCIGKQGNQSDVQGHPPRVSCVLEPSAIPHDQQ